MSEVPDLTTPELRALRIAARHRARTPLSERVEMHPQGKQYVATLIELGLLAKTPWSGHGGRVSWEVTPLAVETLRAYWLRERMTKPLDQCLRPQRKS